MTSSEQRASAAKPRRRAGHMPPNLGVTPCLIRKMVLVSVRAVSIPTMSFGYYLVRVCGSHPESPQYYRRAIESYLGYYSHTEYIITTFMHARRENPLRTPMQDTYEGGGIMEGLYD